MDRTVRMVLIVVVALLVAVAAGAVGLRLLNEEDGVGRSGPKERAPAPVAVAPIIRDRVEERLLLSGEIQANAQVLVAAKVAGRLLSMQAELGDLVKRDSIIATLDEEDFAQVEQQARAALAVAEAELAAQQSQVAVAEAEAERNRTLLEQGVVAESVFQRAEAAHLAAQAAVAVAEAKILEAKADLDGALLDRKRTAVIATWQGADEQRAVSQRWVDPGQLIEANEPLLELISIDPAIAVVHVTEAQYGRLQLGMAARLHTDAYPGQTFTAKVVRLAPQFSTASRQAQVELQVANADGLLKPGMFIRGSLVVAEVAEASLVPEAALVSRGGKPAVFVVNNDGATVRKLSVAVGLRSDGLVQITAEGLSADDAARVVTLGHQLLDDGSPITIPDQAGGQ